jgi:hypothetical protein
VLRAARDGTVAPRYTAQLPPSYTREPISSPHGSPDGGHWPTGGVPQHSSATLQPLFTQSHSTHRHVTGVVPPPPRRQAAAPNDSFTCMLQKSSKNPLRIPPSSSSRFSQHAVCFSHDGQTAIGGDGTATGAQDLRRGAATPVRLTATLYALIAALQAEVVPEDDARVVATVVRLLRSRRSQHRGGLWKSHA